MPDGEGSDSHPAGLWAAVGAIAALVSLRGVLSVRGYLYMDDFAFRYWAATEPLGLTYLTQPYGGHVNPLGLAVQWVLQRLFPGSHLALAAFSTVCFALALMLFASIILRLTRRWLGVVLGVVVAGVSLFGFEVTVWWAAAIYAGPYQVFLLACLYSCLRAVESGSRRWVALALVAGVGLVLSFSRGFVAIPLIMALVVALPSPSGEPLGISATVRAAPRLWAGLAVTAAAGATFVLSHVGTVTRPGFDLGQLPGYMWNLLVLNVLPAIWGGPWRWFEVMPEVWQPIVANPAPPWWAVWLSVVASLALFSVIWLRRPTLRPTLAVSIGYVLAVLLMAGVARSGSLTASVAYRYTFDVVWPITLLIVLAIVPTMGETRRVWRPGVALVALTTVLAVFSTVVPARDWAGNQAKQYMANAVSGFGQIPEGHVVLDQGVPLDLVHPAFMAPYANARTIMTPQPGAPVFGPYAEETLYGFSPDGRVEEQDVAGPTSLDGPDPECGYRITEAARVIPLDGELIAWDFYARVAYFTGTPTTLNLAVGGQIHTVPLRAGGLHAVFLPVGGPGDQVLVSVGTPGVVACVTDVRVGNRVSKVTGESVPLPVTELAS